MLCGMCPNPDKAACSGRMLGCVAVVIFVVGAERRYPTRTLRCASPMRMQLHMRSRGCLFD